MPATLSVMVFVFAAGLAVVALVQSWAVYGQAALALHGRIPGEDDLRELRFTVLETGKVAPGATILRPDFRRKLPARQACPSLLAAA